VDDIVVSGPSGDVATLYTIQKSTGASLTSTSGTITTTSSADSVNGSSSFSGETFYKVGSGDTESFTITVSGTNQTDAKQVQAYLSDIQYTTSTSSGSVQDYTANLADDSQTGYQLIN
jgi:hypothetical protein